MSRNQPEKKRIPLVINLKKDTWKKKHSDYKKKLGTVFGLEGALSNTRDADDLQ